MHKTQVRNEKGVETYIRGMRTMSNFLRSFLFSWKSMVCPSTVETSASSKMLRPVSLVPRDEPSLSSVTFVEVFVSAMVKVMSIKLDWVR
jgi:hypothetical protein